MNSWFGVCDILKRRVNMVQKMCTHVSKCKKMIPVETTPGIGEGEG
jgi:hypothetical protein